MAVGIWETLAISVVGTLLATVLALASGYRLVLWLGAGCYLLAALCLWPAEAAD